MRMSSTLVRSLAIGALVAVPSLANADVYTRAWTTCSVGPLRSCHSASMQTVAVYTGNVRTGTAVLVKLANLQGTHWADNMAFSGLRAARFYTTAFGAPNTANDPNTSVAGTPVGGATGSGSWTYSSGTDATGRGVVRFVGTNTRMIQGCAPMPGSTFGTCPGEVAFSANSGLIFDATSILDLQLTWDPNNTQCITSTQAGPSTVALCDREFTVVEDTVTPEPVSIALLGTGLFGLGGARLRRRTKKQDEV